MANNPGSRLIGRNSLWIIGFVLMMALAGWFMLADTATADAFGTPQGLQSVSSGTIPPPGTVPYPATVTFVHAAPVSSSLPVTAVDVCDEDGMLVNAELAGVVYGDVVTLSAPVGIYDWKITPAGANCMGPSLDVPAFELRWGTFQLVIVIGDNVNQPLGVIVTAPNVGNVYAFLPLVENTLPAQ